MVWPYSACSGEACAAALIASGPMLAISERGVRILVHATGVGAPRATVSPRGAVPSASRAPGIQGEPPEDSDGEGYDWRRQWQRRLADGGWAAVHWPVEYGGRGGTPTQKAIYDEEMARARAPLTVNTLGLTFLGPTVPRTNHLRQPRVLGTRGRRLTDGRVGVGRRRQPSR